MTAGLSMCPCCKGAIRGQSVISALTRDVEYWTTACNAARSESAALREEIAANRLQQEVLQFA